MIVTAGSTNISVYYYIVQDASATSPGEPVTGLLFSDIETGGSASYARQGAARVDLTLITLASASATHADGGFILVDDTNMPGLYRCDYPDAAFATGIDQVMLQIVVASANNAVASPIFVDITDVDLRDSIRGGMTALPNAAADAAGGLPISDTGGLDLDGRLDAAVSSRLAPTVASRTLDITATGAAGLDWGNVENKTTTNVLSGTTVGTTTDLGASAVDDIWDEVLTGATHNVADSAGRRLRDLQEFGTYEGGAVWIDTINGSPGTTDFESGTVFNPVNTLADAITIGASLGLIRFQVANGSTITFAESHDGETWMGINWTLALGGQSVSASFFKGAAVSGICTGASRPEFEECEIGNVTMPPCHINGTSGFTGTITAGSAGDFDLVECNSLVPGTGAPTFDLAAVGATNINVRSWSGGLTFANIAAGDVVSIEGAGGIITVGGTGGTINIRGIFEGVTDSSSAAVAITEIATLNRTSMAGYDGGAVWLDSNGTNSGILPYVDGTADNPVNNIADATTIAALIGTDGITKFELFKGTSITLAQTYNRFIFTGNGGTIALGGQDIAFCTFEGHNISGIGIGSGRTFWSDCRLNSVTLNGAALRVCSLNGTLTLSEATDYSFKDCYATDETTGLIVDFSTPGAAEANFNAWSGIMEVQNMTALDTITIEGTGKITFNANCTGGAINLRGALEVTNSGSGTITYSDLNQDTIDTLVDTGTTLPAQISGLNDITAQDVLDAGDIDGFSLEEANKIELAALGGELSGAATGTNIIRAADDSKARITATVDADGNRSAVTLDGAG